MSESYDRQRFDFPVDAMARPLLGMSTMGAEDERTGGSG